MDCQGGRLLLGNTGVRAGRDIAGAEGDGIGLLVGGEKFAVAVRDVAPGGLDGLGGGDMGIGLGQVVAGVDDLGVVEDPGKSGQRKSEGGKQEIGAADEMFSFFHGGVLSSRRPGAIGEFF